MIRRLAFAPLVAALCLPPLAAAADTSIGQDEVTLKNGESVRGTVVSLQSGVRVKIIELGHSRARTIAWSRVRNVARGKFAPKSEPEVASASAPPPSAPSPAPAPPPANAVRLHVESPKPALVYSHESTNGEGAGAGAAFDRATPICFAPCDKVIDPAAPQTFTANGDFNPSSNFTLTGLQGDVELSLRPGSHDVRVAGQVLTVAGGALAVVGATLAIVGAALGSATVNVSVNGQPSTSTTDPRYRWLVPTGIGIGSGGVAALVAGVIALVESKTSIELHPMGAHGAKTEASARYWMGEF